MAQFSDVQHGKKHWLNKPQDQGSHIPSPEEIKRECEMIRARWSAHTLRERCIHQTEPLTVARSFRSNLGQAGVYRRHFSVEGRQ